MDDLIREIDSIILKEDLDTFMAELIAIENLRRQTRILKWRIYKMNRSLKKVFETMEKLNETTEVMLLKRELSKPGILKELESIDG